MKVLSIVFAVLMICTAAPGAVAQTAPYVTDVRIQGNGSIRGTLVNPLLSPLTAWSIDAVDASKRIYVTEITEALLSPARVLPPQSTIEVMVGSAAPATTLVFAAGVTADGVEVGDISSAFKIVEMRLKRAQALGAALDFLRALDPSTPSAEVYRDLGSLLGTRNAAVLEDVRQRAANGPPVAWLAAAEDVRQRNEAGARRHGALRVRLLAAPGEQQRSSQNYWLPHLLRPFGLRLGALSALKGAARSSPTGNPGVAPR